MSLPTRRAGQRTGRPIRRSSAGLSRTRALAAFVLVLSSLAIYGVGVSPAFGLQRVDLSGASWTSSEAVQAELGVADGTNLVTLRTDALAARIETLPAVRSAEVSVDLPNTIKVRLDERVPILVWQTPAGRYLVDASGVAFVELADGQAAPSGLPTITDSRAGSTIGVGSSIDPVSFDAAARLGSLKPADLDSAANGLLVSLTDDQGFTVKAVPNLWTAVFGFYTTSLRSPGMIPGQVRLLRSLISGREPTIESVILADEQNGTYTTKPSKP
jgi:POTRA domain, FtsQ-type